MGLFSPEWFTALLSIIVIDLVLAGDNAIVIGMAARNIPKVHQNKVILLGTAGAIVIRVVSTIAVAWLLKVPGLLLAGGLLLFWIAYKLLTEKNDEHQIAAKSNLWGAVQTIIVADAVMGMDNVLAIAGASHGSIPLVITGLLISVPVVVWGSTMFVKLVQKFPVVIYIGSGVLAFTAAKMILHEPILKPAVEVLAEGKWLLAALAVTGVLFAGFRKSRAEQPVELKGMSTSRIK